MSISQIGWIINSESRSLNDVPKDIGVQRVNLSVF